MPIAVKTESNENTMSSNRIWAIVPKKKDTPRLSTIRMGIEKTDLIVLYKALRGGAFFEADSWIEA